MYMTVACLVIVHIQFNTVNLIIGKCLMSLWLHSHYKPHCSILMFWLRSDLPESNCNVNASVIRHATHARIDMFLHESSVSPTNKKNHICETYRQKATWIPIWSISLPQIGFLSDVALPQIWFLSDLGRHTKVTQIWFEKIGFLWPHSPENIWSVSH